MKDILDIQLTVFMKAGSKQRVTAPFSLFIWSSYVAMIALSFTSSSYFLPVLLSVTLSVLFFSVFERSGFLDSVTFCEGSKTKELFILENLTSRVHDLANLNDSKYNNNYYDQISCYSYRMTLRKSRHV